MAIISVLSLAHWVAAGVWHAQRQFWWLATGSFALVGMAVAAYMVWYRRNGIRVERDDMETDSEEGAQVKEPDAMR